MKSLLAALGACAALAAAGAPLKPLTFEDMPEFKESKATVLGWSTDSKSVYGTEREPDAKATKVVKIDAATGTRVALGEFAGQGFSVSPRADAIVHFDSGAWRYVNVATGKSEEMFKSPGFQFLVVPPQWSRDGRYLAVLELVQPEGLPRLDPSTIETKGGVRVIDAGAAADQMMQKLSSSRITVIEVATRNVVWKFTGSVRYLDIAWGTGDRLYYGGVDDGDLASPHSTLTELTVSTQQTRVISETQGMVQPFRRAVSPDGKWLATSYNFAHPNTDNFKNLVVIDLATLKARRLSGPERVSSSYQWTGDGKAIVFGERTDGLAHLSRVSLDGRTTVLTHDAASASELHLSPDSSHAAYVSRDVYGGLRMMTLPLSGGQAKSIWDVATYSDKFDMGTFEAAHYTARDGVRLHGYLFKPKNFDPSKKYPVIVDIHGGGIGAALFLFGPLWATHIMAPLEWHAWTNMGYVVLVPEMRSSGECGEAAAANNYIRDAGGLEGDIQDITAATDWILSQPYVDASRAALFGLSAGGGRVNKFLTIDHRYAAGIILDPIRSGPLESLITQALPPYTGVKIGPQPCLDAIARGDTSKCEPGFLFDGVNSNTPTLIFVGNQEMGAVLGFSMDVLFTTLRKNNVPARMLRYMAEGHGSNSSSSAAHKTEEMRLWMEKYVLRTAAAKTQ
jgi:dipeptidyl aminopeptidase/acylaminoacyl peptidase